MTPRKMPIGIQDFEDLRTNGYVYVDKTAYIYRLVTEGKPYFLGRPRRFGKSLLLSTLKAYFQGRKDLFEGQGGQAPLFIAEQEKDWIEYPVFHIDLNVASYTDPGSLQIGLDANLRFIEEKWGRNPAETTPSTRFLGLIRRACEKTGRKVVVLVDEYDRPLLQTMESERDQEDIRRELKGFYGVLKTADPWLRFVLLTGITKFSQVSVFSDLNQLRDISMEEAYAGICGISTAELTGNFEPELRALAEKNGMSYEDALAGMQKRYNGYHFSAGAEGVFNPFSVLNTLAKRNFAYYWFQTGTPTYLIRQLQKTGFDLREFAGGLTVPAQSITDYRMNGGSPVPILYQSGYLTIQDYNRQFDSYTLGFPNQEVEYGFLNSLLPYYMPRNPDRQDFFVGNFIKDLQAGHVDGFMNRLKAFFAGIPYELNDKTERHYQTLFYLVFRLMGQYTEVEQRGSQGRSDAVVRTADTVYLFEFKLATGGAANPVEAALRQIDEKGYLIPWTASGKKLVKVGAVFDPAARTLGDWKAVSGMKVLSQTDASAQ
ncbi:MAG: ATP-binding protein [Treponema sp.]|jgi:hypothetical protein|nr:ATP-binding protein [Treponema sp.]